MKKKELPQDQSALIGVTREVCYVKDEDGKYTTDLSTGWNVKSEALDNAWDDIKDRIEAARAGVANGTLSPVTYFMELKLMDLKLLADYTGYWQFTIKRHMKPTIFNALSDKQLERYAKAFDVSIADFKNYKGQ
jgi:hypothetical protein